MSPKKSIKQSKTIRSEKSERQSIRSEKSEASNDPREGSSTALQGAGLVDMKQRSIMVRSIFSKARKSLHDGRARGEPDAHKPQQKMLRAVRAIADSAKSTCTAHTAVMHFMSIPSDRFSRTKLQKQIDSVEEELHAGEDAWLALSELYKEAVGSEGMEVTEVVETIKGMHGLQDTLSSLKETFEKNLHEKVQSPHDEMQSQMLDVQKDLHNLQLTTAFMMDDLKAISGEITGESGDHESWRQGSMAMPANVSDDPVQLREAVDDDKSCSNMRACAIAVVFEKVLFRDVLGNIQTLAEDVSRLSQEMGGDALDFPRNFTRGASFGSEAEQVSRSRNRKSEAIEDGEAPSLSKQPTASVLDDSPDAADFQNLHHTRFTLHGSGDSHSSPQHSADGRALISAGSSIVACAELNESRNGSPSGENLIGTSPASPQDRFNKSIPLFHRQGYGNQVDVYTRSFDKVQSEPSPSGSSPRQKCADANSHLFSQKPRKDHREQHYLPPITPQSRLSIDSVVLMREPVVPANAMASSLSPRLPQLLGRRVVSGEVLSKRLYCGTHIGHERRKPCGAAHHTVESIINERKTKNLRYKDLWRGIFALDIS